MLVDLEQVVSFVEKELGNMKVEETNLVVIQKKMISDLRDREIDQDLVEELVASIKIDVQGVYSEEYDSLIERLIKVYGKIFEDYYQEVLTFTSTETAVKAFMFSMARQMSISF